MKNFLATYGTLIVGLLGIAVTTLIGLNVLTPTVGTVLLGAVTTAGHLLGSINDTSTPSPTPSQPNEK